MRFVLCKYLNAALKKKYPQNHVNSDGVVKRCVCLVKPVCWCVCVSTAVWVRSFVAAYCIILNANERE